MTTSPHHPSLLQPVELAEAMARGIRIDILRLDLLHPVISGNKWFKLKGHFGAAQRSGSGKIITYGGAWSNHLVATAYAAREAGFQSIGIVRGERPPTLSVTLTDSLRYGMTLEFISRQQYAKKETAPLLERYPGAYIIPEGGGGLPGIEGSEDILRTIDNRPYTHILCAIGTATMFHGLVRASLPGQTVIGVPVLKGYEGPGHLWNDYHFGGYGRHPQPLLDFMNEFYGETGVPSDIVYTGKLFYGLRDGIRRDRLPAGARVLVIHSGGLQGNLSLPPGTLKY